MTFRTAPDFETKSSYTVIVTATDGTLTDTQTITVNIIEVINNSGNRSGGGSSSNLEKVCKDKRASNYESVGKHKKSLCVYGPTISSSVTREEVKAGLLRQLANLQVILKNAIEKRRGSAVIRVAPVARQTQAEIKAGLVKQLANLQSILNAAIEKRRISSVVSPVKVVPVKTSAQTKREIKAELIKQLELLDRILDGE